MVQPYAIIDRDALRPFGLDLGDVARALVDGGAVKLQLRAKGASHDELMQSGARVLEACRGAIAAEAIFMNDDAHVARRLGVGLHLGQDDMSPIAARSLLGPGALIGFSTHDERQLTHGLSLPVDYVALGPVRATASKLRPDATLGLEVACSIARRARACGSTKPLVAIGGITPDVVHELSAFDLIAVIGCVLPRPGEVSATALATITRRTRDLSDACARAQERARTECS